MCQKLNMRHWTPEERAKQAELIRKWKPWEKSTGPQTEHGKQCSSQNSRKHHPLLSRWIILSRKRRNYQELKEEKARADYREKYMRSLLARLDRLERVLEQRAKSKQSK